MYVLILILLVFPGIMINWWLTKRERLRKHRRGFEVKLNTGELLVPREERDTHG
jgi:hypothetical protein